MKAINADEVFKDGRMLAAINDQSARVRTSGIMKPEKVCH
jgi:hypothetical protein